MSGPFHEGELAVQERANKIIPARLNSSAIADQIPRGGTQFIEQQSMVIIGSMDLEGKLWASVLFGRPGFLNAVNSREIVLDEANTGISADDPLWLNIKANTQVGLLFIRLDTRQRLRVNGRIRSIPSGNYSVAIDQAYPNCPKYIQRRHLIVGEKRNNPRALNETSGTNLNEDQQALIVRSDTFFVASAHPNDGMDVSHRGGQPGFVRIRGNRYLNIPDYAGNNLFNTLGNFQSYPFAGLVFIDFQRQRLLQLTGKVKILWDSTDDSSGGAKRFWEFEIQSWQQSRIPFSVSWEFLEYSPFNPEPVTVTETQALFLRIEKINRLSPRIKSFVLSDVTNKDLPMFEAGAHLPVKIVTKDGREMLRHYSLVSDFRDRARYEIAVQEELQGRGGSLYLHDEIKEGDVLQAKAPRNDFPMVAKAQHSVLIAGGIGITPIVSMLRQLSLQKKSFEIHYAVRSHADFVMLDTIKRLAGNRFFCYTSQDEQANPLDLEVLLASPQKGTQLYVCGPERMIQSVFDLANTNGWWPEQIHFESFGVRERAEDKPVHLFLSQSKKTILVPAHRSLLDALLEEGVDIPHQCKRGECGMCVTRVLSGEADHRDLCLSDEQRKTSMCLCASRAKGRELSLEL